MMTTKANMTKNPFTLSVEDTILDAYKLMREKSIRHLPVVNDLGKVVGILSDRDVQRAMNVSQPTPYMQQIRLNPEFKVAEFMSWPVYAVTEDTSLKKVAEEMLAQKVSAFVVEDPHERLVGIITTDDMLKYFITETNKNQTLRSLSQYFTGPELY